MTNSPLRVARRGARTLGLAAVLACGANLAAPRPALAQESPAAAAAHGPTVSAIEDLVRTIEDPERRERLVTDLRLLVEARRGAAPGGAEPAAREESLIGGIVRLAGGLADRIRETAVVLVEQVARVPDHGRALAARLEDGAERAAFLYDAGTAAGVLVAALAAAFAAYWLTRRPRAALALPPARPYGPLLRLSRLLGIAALEIAPSAAFFAVAFFGLTVTSPRPDARLLVLAFASATVLRRGTIVVARVLLAPHASALRLSRASDETAASLEAWTARIASLAAYGRFALDALAIVGADRTFLGALRNVYGLALLVMAVAFVLRQRQRVSERLSRWLEPGPEKPARAWRSAAASLAHAWWIGAIVYLFGLFLAWASEIGDFPTVIGATVLSALLLALGAFVFALFDWVAARLDPRVAAVGSRFPEIAASVKRYANGLRLVLKIAIGLVIVAFVFEAWGVQALAFLESAFVSAAFSALLGILFVFLIAAAVIDVSTMLTQRHLEARERAGLASNKTRTILPLARKAIRVVVVTVAFVTALGQAGVNVGPLLAGVGVVGLAIGFGAQTLVKDIITGLFILMEDTISVGDVVEVNGTGGLVESVDIRTVRLRDASGAVHTIPYSSIAAVKNMARDFGCHVASIGVAYKEDVDSVIGVIREVGASLQRSPDLGRLILEPIDVLGLERFDDSAVVIQARIKTRPTEQAKVGREFNRLLKKAFDERGIEIPFPHRTVNVVGMAPPLPSGGNAAR